jgi:hypothetical protein
MKVLDKIGGRVGLFVGREGVGLVVGGEGGVGLPDGGAGGLGLDVGIGRVGLEDEVLEILVEFRIGGLGADIVGMGIMGSEIDGSVRVGSGTLEVLVEILVELTNGGLGADIVGIGIIGRDIVGRERLGSVMPGIERLGSGMPPVGVNVGRGTDVLVELRIGGLGTEIVGIGIGREIGGRERLGSGTPPVGVNVGRGTDTDGKRVELSETVGTVKLGTG